MPPTPRATSARSRPSSIRDVAGAAGVSAATVSRALRGLDRVSAATRERVVRIAAELDYAPSPVAATLASGRTRTVAVIVPFIDRWYFATMIAAVERRLREDGYHLLIHHLDERGSEDRRGLTRQMLDKTADAVLFVATDLDDDEVAVLTALRQPIVTVGVHVPGRDRVGIDEAGTTRTAAEHLLGLGHRRIAYLGGGCRRRARMDTAGERRRGVADALRDAGLDLDPALAADADWSVPGGRAATAQLLTGLAERGETPPTALLVASDEMAIGALCAARDLGIEVPARLSVIGVDDHAMASTHELTTVSQPVAEQGRAASELLLAALGEPGAGARARPRELVLPTSLVRRGTTAPPP